MPTDGRLEHLSTGSHPPWAGGCPRWVFTPLPTWITLAHEPSRLLGHQKESGKIGSKSLRWTLSWRRTVPSSGQARISLCYRGLGEFSPSTAFQTLNCIAVKLTALQLVLHQNGVERTEAKDVKKRWQQHTDNLFQEGLCHTQVCCTQSPCGSLLLTHTSTGEIGRASCRERV